MAPSGKGRSPSAVTVVAAACRNVSRSVTVSPARAGPPEDVKVEEPPRTGFTVHVLMAECPKESLTWTVTVIGRPFSSGISEIEDPVVSTIRVERPSSICQR